VLSHFTLRPYTMVVDFFQICRKEAAADALIAHQF